MVDHIAVFGADLDAAEPLLRAVGDADTSTPWRPGTWTRREILGHLIDSASVNHERLVQATRTDHLVFDGYDQDERVRSRRCHEASWERLVDLWIGLNRYLVRLMAAVPSDVRFAARSRHTLDRIAFRPVPADRPATLDHLMSDYIVHLEHHLTQILGEGWPFRDHPTAAPAGRTILATDRLVLRELTAADLPFVSGILGDAETMRFYDHPCTPLEARLWLHRQFDRYATDGHGLWLVVDRETSARVGQVGLAMQDVGGAREPEIGWLIQRPCWRRGFATEAATGVRHHAFQQRGLDHVISLIRPENAPSQGVARKLGMHVERDVLFHGHTHHVYTVHRP